MTPKGKHSRKNLKTSLSGSGKATWKEFFHFLVCQHCVVVPSIVCDINIGQLAFFLKNFLLRGRRRREEKTDDEIVGRKMGVSFCPK